MQALERHFAGLADWLVPPGGLFVWLRLKLMIDTQQLLPEAIKRGVAFMPGEAFYPERRVACGALRLNFSHSSVEQIERGLAILAELVVQAGSGAGMKGTLPVIK